MSQDLLYTYVTGFDRTIRSTVELTGGKMRQFVEQATGDLFHSDGVYQFTSGGGLPQKVTNRFGDSPVSELDYTRRRVTRTAFDDGHFMDWPDVAKMGTDPRNKKLTAMRDKFLRKEDLIIDQALLGTAQGGDNGETTTVFDTSNIIDVTLGAASGYTNAGFNYSKFLATLTKFGENNVDLESAQPIFKLSYAQWQNMMEDDKFINHDYSTSRPIDAANSAMIKEYMGCKFVITNIVPWMNTAGTGFNIADTDINTTVGKWTDTDSTDIRAVSAFVQDAVLLEINPEITTDIGKRFDKKGSWYAYMKVAYGAVRTQEALSIAIPCDQSPSPA